MGTKMSTAVMGVDVSTLLLLRSNCQPLAAYYPSRTNDAIFPGSNEALQSAVSTIPAVTPPSAGDNEKNLLAFRGSKRRPWIGTK
ncbi:hypothetical protein H7J83_27880 [Mycobacterium mantenii]|uniref:hypothetical protein n=1 Tax=Mycobacterium mantenii TaxID=560555 RepID=UPI001153E08C|nr:hypothetical protein [Mycobacterium mantenii]MCV7246491.1 hypothetical protein [Mycobacterium mantenii]